MVRERGLETEFLSSILAQSGAARKTNGGMVAPAWL
jgi:hypothetical protein